MKFNNVSECNSIAREPEKAGIINTGSSAYSFLTEMVTYHIATMTDFGKNANFKDAVK